MSLAVLITRRILKWSIAGWMVEILLLGVRPYCTTKQDGTDLATNYDFRLSSRSS